MDLGQHVQIASALPLVFLFEVVHAVFSSVEVLIELPARELNLAQRIQLCLHAFYREKVYAWCIHIEPLNQSRPQVFRKRR